MMKPLPPGYLATLRENVSLVEVTSRWLVWDSRKTDVAKKSYWASCPFCSEKNATLHVDGRKGFYYCFNCQSKGDIITFVKEISGTDFRTAVRKLAREAGMEDVLEEPLARFDSVLPDLIKIKEFIVENFEKDHFIEIGILTNNSQFVRNHQRLLRSLGWGDPDYPGCVLELLVHLESQGSEKIDNVRKYIIEKFPEKFQGIISLIASSSMRNIFGFEYTPSRNDVISVMMPISVDLIKFMRP